MTRSYEVHKLKASAYLDTNWPAELPISAEIRDWIILMMIGFGAEGMIQSAREFSEEITRLAKDRENG